MSLLNTGLPIPGLPLKNRLVLPPMAISQADENGHATARTLAHYGERADGGRIGLIIAEHCYVSPEGQASKGQLSIAGEDCLPGLRALTARVHQSGTKLLAQLSHAGGAARPELTGAEAFGPSAAPLPRGCMTAPQNARPPREMTPADIRRVTEAFARAALRAREVGFDGVEIHSAHGYLLNQFYSPLTNRRTDAYTGSTLEGRIRLHREIIRAIRQAVGPDYPLALRLGACDYMEGGSTLEDSVQAAQALVQEGVCLLDISGGLCGYIHPSCRQPGYFGELSQAIRAAVPVPVILTGGVTQAAEAEQLLAQGKADLIGVGRAMLKDSAWAARAMAQ